MPKRFIVVSTEKEKVQCEIKNIHLNELVLDPLNPRLVEVGITPDSVETYDTNFVTKAVKSIADWKDLKISILATKGLQETLYVKQNSDGKYTVREGNRRTLALREIEKSIQNREKGFENHQLEDYTNPECIIYASEMSERDILMHIAQMHVTGKDPWGAFQKAGMVKRMIDELGMDQDAIAKTIGMSKSYIKQYLWAFSEVKKYHESYPNDNNWTSKFSHFQKVYSKKFLKEHWWKNPKHQDMFMEWVNKNKITHAFRIAGKIGLTEVVQDTDAFRYFNKDGNDLNETLDMMKSKLKKKEGIDSMQEEIVASVIFLHDNLERLTTGKIKELRGNKAETAIFKETMELLIEKYKEIKG